MSSSTQLLQAMEYFKEALAYQTSADRLHEQLPAQPRIGLPLSDPVYFLYHHAAELALKACLMSHKMPAPRGHRIEALFARCRRENLLGHDEHREMHNLMVLLDAKDSGKGYRYAGSKDIVAQLAWVQEGVGQLISDIEPHLRAWARTTTSRGPGTHIQLLELGLLLANRPM
jgi:hypothetical protein